MRLRIHKFKAAKTDWQPIIVRATSRSFNLKTSVEHPKVCFWEYD